MTERVRTVRSGIVGLDLALGGGPRFVRRTHMGDRESATIVVRGGPGAGKSVLAQELALRLAGALASDVLYACIEVLPSEIIAQRQGFQGFDEARAVDLSDSGAKKEAVTGPCIVVGMRDIPTVNDVPDLGQSLLDLYRIAASRGFSPKVVVVDSLSDGYHLGGKSPRDLVDGVCKLAVEQGWALILVEEAVSEAAVSPWCFAVDTVLALRLTERGGLAHREMTVAKHRFAACEPGPHRLIFERYRVRVIPPLSAYRNAAQTLSLPHASENRSLRVPVVGREPNWESFHVSNGEGRCVLVQSDGNISTNVNHELLDRLSGNIGTKRANGSTSTGSVITFHLSDKFRMPRSDGDDGFRVGTLDQLSDGAEWLEEVLTQLAKHGGEISRIRVGPTNRLRKYKHQDDMRAAISLFAALLMERGLIVVIFGFIDSLNSPKDVIQGGFVTDFWNVERDVINDLVVKASNQGPGSVTLKPKVG